MPPATRPATTPTAPGDGWFERLVVHAAPAVRSRVGPAAATALAAIDVPFHGCGC
jgi:hypothetical protein